MNQRHDQNCTITLGGTRCDCGFRRDVLAVLRELEYERDKDEQDARFAAQSGNF